MTLEPCGGCQVEIKPKLKACPYCGFQKFGVRGHQARVPDGKPTIDSIVQERIAQGWRVAERRETDVVIEKGEKIPHGTHIFLTVVSFGLWGAIYGLHLIVGGLKRRRVELHRGVVRDRRI